MILNGAAGENSLTPVERVSGMSGHTQPVPIGNIEFLKPERRNRFNSRTPLTWQDSGTGRCSGQFRQGARFVLRESPSRSCALFLEMARGKHWIEGRRERTHGPAGNQRLRKDTEGMQWLFG